MYIFFFDSNKHYFQSQTVGLSVTSNIPQQFPHCITCFSRRHSRKCVNLIKLQTDMKIDIFLLSLTHIFGQCL